MGHQQRGDNKSIRTHQTRLFLLCRLKDVSEISGTGYVAEGTQYHDGQCTLSWFGKYHSLEVQPSIEQLAKIHGHDGKTVVEWASQTYINAIKKGSKCR